MKNPILEFSKTAVATEPRNPDEIKAEIESLGSAHSTLLGIEGVAKKKLEEKGRRLRKDLEHLDTSYMRLSLEPLKWARGWGRKVRPVFAVYTLTDPVMTIRTSEACRRNGGGYLWHGQGQEGPGLPEEIAEQFGYFAERIDDRIKSTFQGVIPKEVKEAIKTAEPLFTRKGMGRPDIFIIAEAEWVTDSEPVPPEPRRWDPLVVGWDGRDLWLIAHFDLTPLEDYVRKEFPALPAGLDQLKLPEKQS